MGNHGLPGSGWFGRRNGVDLGAAIHFVLTLQLHPQKVVRPSKRHPKHLFRMWLQPYRFLFSHICVVTASMRGVWQHHAGLISCLPRFGGDHLGIQVPSQKVLGPSKPT